MDNKQWLLLQKIRKSLTIVVPESQDEANTGTVDWPSLTCVHVQAFIQVYQNMYNNFTCFVNEVTIKMGNMNLNY